MQFSIFCPPNLQKKARPPNGINLAADAKYGSI